MIVYRLSNSNQYAVPFHPLHHQTHISYYLKDNLGNVWKETRYKGDGIFGGIRFMELFEQMNKNSTTTIYPMITTNRNEPWTNQKQTWIIKNKQLSSMTKDIHSYHLFCQEHCFQKQIYNELCVFCNE